MPPTLQTRTRSTTVTAAALEHAHSCCRTHCVGVSGPPALSYSFIHRTLLLSPRFSLLVFSFVLPRSLPPLGPQRRRPQGCRRHGAAPMLPRRLSLCRVAARCCLGRDARASGEPVQNNAAITRLRRRTRVFLCGAREVNQREHHRANVCAPIRGNAGARQCVCVCVCV